MAYEPPVDDSNARTWATLAHVSSFAGYVIPFGGVVAPLVIWLLKREEHWLIEDQAREALNFNITVAIATIISGVLVMVLIGVLLLPLVLLFHLICTILAIVAANKGTAYRYPLTIRLVNKQL